MVICGKIIHCRDMIKPWFYFHYDLNIVNLCYSLVNQKGIPPNKSSQLACNTLRNVWPGIMYH